MSKKFVRRVIAVIPAAALELFWVFALMRWLAPYATLVNLMLSLFAFLYVLYIMASRNEPAYKTLWLLVILGMPVFGTILYFCFGNKRTARPIKKKLEKGRTLLPKLRAQDADVAEELRGENPRLAQTFDWLHNQTGFPVDRCQKAEYYPIGEKMFERMLTDLRMAERFIFAEYFIVGRGKMWDEMSRIMAEKAARGVDVRFMYDDLGSISTFSEENLRWLEQHGIKCVRFNPLIFIKGTLNYRDHRKMLVIDGRVAFSGGINLADEYINAVAKYGHWKDTGFRLTGEPVRSYTRMFAEFWNAFSKEAIPTPRALEPLTRAENGFALSYCDSPLYSEAVSNSLFIELLSQATRRAWFYTPYLLLGDNLREAFMRAASRGVDVRIIMPGVPDKPLVYRMSRSYYRPLLQAGVRIFEYTPGFMHAKACLIDDETCTIGTVNLDYRSLFLHFENNTLFYRASLVKDLEADYLQTQEQSRERTLGDLGENLGKWVLDGILRVFAPLC